MLYKLKLVSACSVSTFLFPYFYCKICINTPTTIAPRSSSNHQSFKHQSIINSSSKCQSINKASKHHQGAKHHASKYQSIMVSSINHQSVKHQSIKCQQVSLNPQSIMCQASKHHAPNILKASSI